MLPNLVTSTFGNMVTRIIEGSFFILVKIYVLPKLVTVSLGNIFSLLGQNYCHSYAKLWYNDGKYLDNLWQDERSYCEFE